MKIASISSHKTSAGIEDGYICNKNLYNDKLLIYDADLNWYDYGFRNYDPQIGRFVQIDPLADDFPEFSGYQYAANDPIMNIDEDGLDPISFFFTAGNTFGNVGAWSFSVVSTVSTVSTLSTVLSVASIGANALSLAGNVSNAISGYGSQQPSLNNLGTSRWMLDESIPAPSLRVNFGVPDPQSSWVDVDFEGKAYKDFTTHQSGVKLRLFAEQPKYEYVTDDGNRIPNGASGDWSGSGDEKMSGAVELSSLTGVGVESAKQLIDIGSTEAVVGSAANSLKYIKGVGGLTTVVGLANATYKVIEDPTVGNTTRVVVQAITVGLTYFCPPVGLALSFADLLWGDDIYKSMDENLK